MQLAAIYLHYHILMENLGVKNPTADLTRLGFNKITAYWNEEPAVLIQKTLQKGQGKLNNTGALVVKTGKFTGRSPQDRYIVKDKQTAELVDWGKINKAYCPEKFAALREKVIAYLDNRWEMYVRDAYAGANPDYRLKVRVIAEFPWQSLFANNMFLRPSKTEIENFEPDWTVISVPTFMADVVADETRQSNFAIINFSTKEILIGGTAYTGEIKKGIFSALNFILPTQHDVLPMHCSANVGNENGDTSLFFGLSGTGKTTLSTDPNRKLIGDDEHGWSADSVFNFEGGCYAKCIDLSAEKEPQIYNAIKFGALLENVIFKAHSSEIDYEDISITPNTRVSYPIHHIDNIMPDSMGKPPKNIFFLTFDAFGVLPPISKLNTEQAMYHFVSGYTAKVAGTEVGINEPKAAFSACFGAPFLPLHPFDYAKMLGERLETYPEINVWLVNTGLNGSGKRMKLAYTRAMITAALNGDLNDVDYQTEPTFELAIPTTCPNVPANLLNPANSWPTEAAYETAAKKLSALFDKNYEQFNKKKTSTPSSDNPLATNGMHPITEDELKELTM